MLHCIVLYCTVLYCTVLYCVVLCCTVLYCAALHCTVLYCTVLCCTVLYCAALHCTVLYCIENDPQLIEANHSDNTSEICSAIQDTVLRHLDRHAPMRKHQVKTKSPQFLSQPTKQLENERNAAYRLARQTDTPDNWRLYRNLRNRVHKEITKDKKYFLKNKLNDENSVRDQWDVTKEIPSIIMNEGKAISSPKAIADILNFKLLEKVSRTIAKLPKPTIDPMINYRKVIGNRTCQFQLEKISMHELRKTINYMKNSRTAGMDGISINTIKKLWKQLEVPILRLVNTSIENNDYPASLKQSRVIPLLKISTPPKSPTDPGSYRGINLLMSIGKIIDKVILKQVLHYLIQNQLIHHAHHGSIRGRSTTTAVVTLMDTWSELVENGNEIATIALD